MSISSLVKSSNAPTTGTGKVTGISNLLKLSNASGAGHAYQDPSLATPEPAPKKSIGQKVVGFGKSIVNDAANTLLVTPADRATEAITRTVFPKSQAAKGYEAMADAKENRTFNVPILNKISGPITVDQQKAFGQGGAEQIAGKALKTAAYLAPYGKIAKVTGDVGAGAIAGGAFGAGGSMEEGGSLKDVAINTAVGGAIGAAIPLAFKGIKKLLGSSTKVMTPGNVDPNLTNEQIAEKAGGWLKPGIKAQFDRALGAKDGATIAKLLPDVPADYQGHFSKEIIEGIGKENFYNNFIKNPSSITLFRGENPTNIGGGHFTTDSKWAANFGEHILKGNLPADAKVIPIQSIDFSKFAEQGITKEGDVWNSFFKKGIDAIIGSDSHNSGIPDIIVNPKLLSNFTDKIHASSIPGLSNLGGATTAEVAGKIGGEIVDLIPKAAKIAPKVEGTIEKTIIPKVESTVEKTAVGIPKVATPTPTPEFNAKVDNIVKIANNTFERQTNKQQIATILKQTDQQIEDVVFRGATPKENIPKEAYVAVLQEKAEQMALKGDVSLADRLSQSNAFSQAGQGLQAASLADKTGLTGTLREIRRELEDTLPKSTKSKKNAEIASIQQKLSNALNEFKDIVPGREDILKVIDSLKC